MVDNGKNLDHVEDPAVEAQGELATIANLEEHEVGKLASLRQYPLACFWCIYAVWCVLLVSFENQAAGSVISIPEFRKDFGYLYDGEWTLPAQWQSAFSGAPVASAIFGSLACGQVADLIGRRGVLMICFVITFAAVTVEFIATTNAVFFAGKFINGFAVGAIATITVAYTGEITPLALRGVFTCLNALSYTLGPLTVAIIVNFTGEYDSRWAYRAVVTPVFCAQYGFAVISTILVFFMPESPWWLASKGRNDAALRSLNKLGHKGEHGASRLALIQQTLEKAKEETAGATYLECFRVSNLRRTIISIMPLAIQSLSGITFVASYSTYYIQLAGFDTAESFKLQIVQQGLSLFGNICSWYLVDRIGRRNLTFYGLLVLTGILFSMAACAVVGGDGPIKGTVAMIMLYCWWYNVTIGATAYTILAEVSTSRLRGKTVAIGFALQNVLNMIWSFVLPYLFNPDYANLGAKVAFIFGGLAVFCLVYLFIYQPETAGRSYQELDEMFSKKIPARHFKDFKTESQETNAQLTGDAAKQAMQADL
ncbi:hypothetical protein SUNI508_04595 [Seiridium unicorne]|uniref:Major facilitator superfamily (MFS) profile domain-containing protein n=1 Tax=Seiridium unicorne TaxID=138068 RepID=A0ABR2V7P7_9PEZI